MARAAAAAALLVLGAAAAQDPRYVCRANRTAAEEQLNNALSYACTQVDCSPILPCPSPASPDCGMCYLPNDLIAHCDWAFDVFYQAHMGTCSFSGAAVRSTCDVPRQPNNCAPCPTTPEPVTPAPAPAPIPVPVTPDPAPDPTCSKGILKSDGSVCCLASCGTCGGGGCGDLPGGHAGCCTSQIEQSGVRCAAAPAPCIMGGAPTPPPSPPAPPVAPAYETNFTSADSSWVLEGTCSHCGKRDGDECTKNDPGQVAFGADGMVITTQKLATPAADCGSKPGLCLSGHASYHKALLYGDFTIVAKFFPGAADLVRSATGFIGWDADGNTASVTYGFHGKGWDGEEDWDSKFQCAWYATSKDQHDQEVIGAGAYVTEFNTYRMIWAPDKVQWYVNGVVKRTETTEIPTTPMVPRLHSRSGYCGTQMPANSSFQATFKYWSYTPVSASRVYPRPDLGMPVAPMLA